MGVYCVPKMMLHPAGACKRDSMDTESTCRSSRKPLEPQAPASPSHPPDDTRRHPGNTSTPQGEKKKKCLRWHPDLNITVSQM